MRLTKRHRPTISGFNMTPMIDIVFLLIIFFMTVSQITHVMDHPVQLPQVPSAGDQEEIVLLTINIDVQGMLLLAGVPHTLDEARSVVAQQLDLVDGQTERLHILVRCDRRAPSRYVNELMRELTEMRIYRVRISVESDQ